VARFQCFRTTQLRVRWRLLGGNNRVLGVSARDLVDHAAALAEVEAVRAGVGAAEFGLERIPSGLWWWRMRLSGKDFARSAHGFARRVDATLACQRFQVRAPGATTDLTLVVFAPGRRGREIPFEQVPADTVPEGR
jgi:hypothetical protein